MHRHFITVAAAAACATAAIALRSRAPATPRPAATPAVGAASAVNPATTTAATGTLITFPDGSQRPVLNGVDEPVALQWPDDRPYAPVVATVRDGGTEWFRHEDGSWSTTLRLLDQATGRQVTMCPVYQPGPSQPKQLRGQ